MHLLMIKVLAISIKVADPPKGKVKVKRDMSPPSLICLFPKQSSTLRLERPLRTFSPTFLRGIKKRLLVELFKRFARSYGQVQNANMAQGKGLVGTVSELSLVRRAQLAVTAHIRHTYTNYDLLLKSMRWGEARQAVQQQCLDKLVQWRGDDDDDGEMADILQEVIVISDDEDENQHDAKSRRKRHGRSDSVQFISADDINTQAINYAAANSTTGPGRSLSLDSDDADAVKYLGHGPLLNGSPVHYNQHRLHRIGAHRHRMWEEAVDRRRKNHSMVYATDNYSPMSAPGRFGLDYYQDQQANRLQSYGSKPVAHTIDRPSTYTRLIPLPALTGQLSHSSEPRGGEDPIFSDQVSALCQLQEHLDCLPRL